MKSVNSNSGIYTITAPSGNFYIGSSKNVGNRWRQHVRDLRTGDHPNRRLQQAWNKHGPEGLAFSVLLVCRPVDLLLYEQAALDAMRPKYNLSPTAGNSLGVTATPERRAKVAKALTGIKRSAETKAKVAEAQAWKRTPEGRAKLALNSKGKKLSAETRARMSAAHTGKSVSPAAIAKRLATKARTAAERGSYFSEAGTASIAAANKARPRIPFSAEHRAKISAAGLGRPRSAETRERLRQANLGRVMPREAVEKTRTANLGRKASAEARQAMSKARTGKQRPQATKDRIRAGVLAHLARKAREDPK